MSFLYLDIETHSRSDVRKVGPYAYAEDPSTEILCAAYALDNAPVKVYAGKACRKSSRLEVTLRAAKDRGWVVVAHNDTFEKCVLSALFGDWVLELNWLDTASLSARMSLPRHLGDLGKFFFPEEPERWKDSEGSKVMKRLSRPRKPSASNPDEWWTPATKPEEFKKLYEYCAQDVRLMRDVHLRLLPLEPREERIRALTEKMNRRGVPIDLASIPLAQVHLAGHLEALAREFRELTGHSAKSRVKLAQYFGLPNMKKGTVRRFMRTELSPEWHRALTIYRILARSSTAKLAAITRRLSKDGRLRGSLTYCGAERTGRWSSMGVQLQNFPRGLGKLTDLAFKALAAGCLCEMFEGLERPAPDRPLDPVGIIAEMLRGFLLGPWTVSDLAQIEARVLNWLAGQDDITAIFRDGGDVYCKMASAIYGRNITKNDKAERFIGKTSELGCGYGLGHKGFRAQLDENFDVAIDEAMAKRIVGAYRKSHPKVVKLWAALEATFVFAIKHRSKRIRVPGIAVPLRVGIVDIADTDYLYLELPSGRKLYYAKPHIKDGQIRYFGRDIKQGGVWKLIKTYGGKIVENATQAIARDVLAEAMLRLDDEGFALNLSVHDETGSEGGDAAEMEMLMTQAPTWAEGLPVAAETFESQRYRK